MFPILFHFCFALLQKTAPLILHFVWLGMFRSFMFHGGLRTLLHTFLFALLEFSCHFVFSFGFNVLCLHTTLVWSLRPLSLLSLYRSYLFNICSLIWILFQLGSSYVNVCSIRRESDLSSYAFLKSSKKSSEGSGLPEDNATAFTPALFLPAFWTNLTLFTFIQCWSEASLSVSRLSNGIWNGILLLAEVF